MDTITVVALLCLILSTITDVRKREIPLLLWGVGMCLSIIMLIAQESAQILLVRALIAIVVFLVYYIVARFFGGGGGDAIMMSVLGFMLGINIVYISLIASLLNLVCLIFLSLTHKSIQSTEVPFAPFVLISFIVFYLIGGIYF